MAHLGRSDPIDHRRHAEQNAASGAYIRWHNARAELKTIFASDSPIRTWTHHPALAAWQALGRGGRWSREEM
ncbi:hypothetical protein [Kitasatospora sp. NPDC001683]